MTAEEYEVVILRKLGSYLMREYSALGRHIYNALFIPFGNIFDNTLVAIVYGLAGHYHTNTAAVGSIVRFSVLVRRKVADVVASHLNKTAILRPADYTLGQNAPHHIRKQS